MRNEDTVVVGRQGIHDVDGLVGYELLFRRLPVVTATPRVTGDQMTAEVVYGALSLGLSSVVGDHLIFCNADRAVLTGTVPLLLPPERTVLEVGTGIELDDQVVAGCRKLTELGVGLALDGFEPGAGFDDLLPLATIAKIDLLMTPPSALPDLAQLCRAHGIRPAALKVQNLDDVTRLAGQGFELFQGHALDRPAVVEGRTLAPGAVGRISSALDVLQSGSDFDALEDVLLKDPALAHQVMLLASLGRPGEQRRRIGSVRDALVFAGTTQIGNWLALLLARPAGATHDAEDAFVTVLIRARVCELLARRCGVDARLSYTAGMLSAMDGLLRVSQDEIVDKLALSTQLREAAFEGTGPVGQLVRDVVDYPYHAAVRPPADEAERTTVSGVPAAELDEAFATAFNWALDAVAELG
ncbi:EAL and HDOD domain-containing protein [uncultured Jatrophihabitans sp.]|uniref:EAL and HDOD domain-containing protein n=1 Tax=uncultured Jatrophihabitans sp. TaxID=1610747 RepID=UPI0035CB84C3